MMRAKKGGAEPINRHTAAGIRIRDDRANKLRASARILSGSVSARRINASCCGGSAEAKNCRKRERERVYGGIAAWCMCISIIGSRVGIFG